MSLFSPTVAIDESGARNRRGRRPSPPPVPTRPTPGRKRLAAVARIGRALVAVACLQCGGTALRAQERIAVPPPDPLPPGTAGRLPPPGPPVSSSPPAPAAIVTQAPPPTPNYPASPYPPPYPVPEGDGSLPPDRYGPPPGVYGPPPPRPEYAPPRWVYRGDPVNDPALWFAADSLIWWSKNQPLSVPLITTGPGSQGPNAGALGMPGTRVLDRPLDYGAQGGVRLTLGGWFNADHTWGVEGNLFILGTERTGFGAADRAGAGNFVINEPVAGAPFSTQVSAPGVETGSASVTSSTRFAGGDINALFNLTRGPHWTVNLMGGFRYLQLNESVDVVADSELFTTTTYTDNVGNTLATAAPGSTITVVDQFSARNQFYGGTVGMRVRYGSVRWSFEGTGSLGIGATHESVMVNGFTNIYPVTGQPVSLQGGNYATLQSGCYAVNRFAVAPQLQLNLGYQFTPYLRGTVGYSFMYLSSVIRPGNQIDNTYDGVARPAVPLTGSSFWAQGVNLGLQFSY